jgi:hypothetical protein
MNCKRKTEHGNSVRNLPHIAVESLVEYDKNMIAFAVRLTQIGGSHVMYT